MATFHFTSGGCGSKKTLNRINLICTEPFEFSTHDARYFVIAQPHTKLLVQTVEMLQSKDFIGGVEVFSNEFYNTDLSKINVKNPNLTIHNKDIVERINKRLKDKPNVPTVLLITHEALMRLEDLYQWELIVDEVFNPITVETIGLKNENKKLIKDVIRASISFDSGFDAIEFNGNQRAYTNDEATNAIYSKLRNIDKFDSVLMNSDFFIDGCNELKLIGIPAVLDTFKTAKSVHFLSNRFEHSILFKYLSQHVIFEPKPLGLRYREGEEQQYHNRIKVRYFSDRDLSFKWITDNDPRPKVVEWVNENNDASFYWTQNKPQQNQLVNIPKLMFKSNDFVAFDSRGNKIGQQVIEMPPMTQGLNDYQTFTTCVWLAAMKTKSNNVAIYEKYFGLTKEDLVFEHEYEPLMQFISRGVIREYASNYPMTIYVFDVKQAVSLFTSMNVPNVSDDPTVEELKALGLDIMKIEDVVDDTVESVGRSKGSRNKKTLSEEDKKHRKAIDSKKTTLKRSKKLSRDEKVGALRIFIKQYQTDNNYTFEQAFIDSKLTTKWEIKPRKKK